MIGTLEPGCAITFSEWMWLGAVFICSVLAGYVIYEFIKIVRKEV